MVERAQHGRIAHAASDHQDAALEAVSFGFAEELRSRLFAEIVVQHDEVDLLFSDDLQSIVDRGTGANDPAIGLGFKQPAEAFPKQGVIIDDQDSCLLIHI